MAGELWLKHTVSGLGTLTALLFNGGKRWDGAALTNVSAIADAAWGTGGVACTELLTSNGTPTGIYLGDMPAIPVAGLPIEIVALFFATATPAPGLLAEAQQSLLWAGATGVAKTPLVDVNGAVTVGAYAAGKDPTDLQLADMYIDKATNPLHWALVYIKRGSGSLTTGTVLLRQTLQDVDGVALKLPTTPVGQSTT